MPLNKETKASCTTQEGILRTNEDRKIELVTTFIYAVFFSINK